MRPLRLVMSAFGPYAGVERIDFRELGNKRFFVITGPTGAGKTSVLDAMTFALYGDTTGDERTGKEMRSLFADPTLMSDVTFDFAVGPDVYRVWRRPEQQRPKLRGGGSTTEKPDAGLWRRTGLCDDETEGEVIASGVRDVDQRVRELLGFDCDQFRQVVVLPQGRFREVLSADVKTREAILRQLFKTDRFARITEHFKAARNESKRAIEGLTERRRGVLENAGVESREQLVELLSQSAEAERAAHEAAATTTAAAEAARTALEAARDAKGALVEAREAQAAVDRLSAQAEQVERQREELQTARRALGVEPAYRSHEQAARALEKAKSAHAAALAELPALEQAHAGSCEAYEAARQASAETSELERLEREASDAERRAQDATRAAGLTAEAGRLRTLLGGLQQREEQARVASAEAVQRVRALEDAWRAAQAAVLAQTLGDGAPCPVCGSVEHPAPARAGGHVSDDELEAARVAAERAAGVAATAAAEVAAGAAAAQAAERHAADEAARLGDGQAADPSRATALAAALRRELDQRRGQARQAAKDLEACEQARTAAHSKLEATRGRAQALGEQVVTCSAEESATAAALAAALDAADFDDPTAFLAVRRTAAEVDALEGAVRRYDESLAAARERLTRATAAAASVTEEPDIDALEQQERSARSEADAAREALGDISRVLAGYRSAIETIDRFEREAAGMIERHSLVARIADVADGSNELKLSFQRFVLGAYLDEVLDHANYRLQRMTGGRYRLARSTKVEHRGRAAGLDLSVFDEQAGEFRPAGTLSGGEGFLASLALALGLAEAVQSHAGGVKLETIFIDEGFGTLDPEALEMAIATLLDLAGVAAEQGRLVGIISHVPELKERIDARLEVTPGERGSTARFVV